jgi:acyl-CoA thioester hydrolase
LARIKIKIQGVHVFEIKDRLRVSDMNYGNHLGNDSVLSLFHNARLAWMESNNQNELNFHGKALIQHDTVINYKSEAFFNDEVLISVYIHDIDTKSFDFYFKMINIKNNKEIAIGKTGMTFFDYSLKKVSSTPTSFSELYLDLGSHSL